MEGGAFLNELLNTGFSAAELLDAHPTARTQNPNILAAEVLATR